MTLQRKNLIAALREDRRLKAEYKELREEEASLVAEIRKAHETGESTPGKSTILRRIRNQIDSNNITHDALYQSTPEAFFGLHLKQLEEYKEQMTKGKIVETPYVEEQLENIIAHIGVGTPVFLHGHLGSGKTELAMHAAREMGKEALVISGSKYTSTAELYGHQTLAVEKIDQEEAKAFAREIENEFNNWKSENIHANEAEQNRSHDRILRTMLASKRGGTVSDYFLGPVYRAMDEGKILIIDEINAIPHEVLISLNHILTRKINDEVDVQQDSGRKVSVKKGFSIIATGNLDEGYEQYVGRQSMDAAFISRFHPIEHDYLPQATEGKPEDAAEEGNNELYQLLLAHMIDKNGNLDAPKSAMDDLWRLAKAARVTQDLFSGKNSGDAYYAQDATGKGIAYKLQKSVLALRGLDRIIRQWKADDFSKELDAYLWNDFVGEAVVAEDRLFLYQLLKNQFGFFSGKNWPEAPGIEKAKSFKITKPPKNQAKERDFTGPREVIRKAFGPEPERTAWPEAITSDEASNELDNMLADFETLGQSMNEAVERLQEEVGAYCEIYPTNS